MTSTNGTGIDAVKAMDIDAQGVDGITSKAGGIIGAANSASTSSVASA
jgi:hypothetical protein